MGLQLFICIGGALRWLLIFLLSLGLLAYYLFGTIII